MQYGTVVAERRVGLVWSRWRRRPWGRRTSSSVSVAGSGLAASAEAGDYEADHAAGVVAGVVAGAGAEAADGAHQLVGIGVGEDLAGRGRGVEQLGARRDEAVEEIGVQG